MEPMRLTGPQAGSVKYDLLTALSVLGLHSAPRLQASLLRLVALVTARYNWRLDEVSVGQRDLARMWNVTERTVKREVRHWQEQSLVICKRPGVRGRVAAYRLNYPEIYRLSEPVWAAVGPDFRQRMQAANPIQSGRIVAVDFAARAVVTPQEEAETDTPGLAREGWPGVRARLRALHPAQYQAWLRDLRLTGDSSGIIELAAPSRFVAGYVETHMMRILHEAVEAVLGPRRRIRVYAPGAS